MSPFARAVFACSAAVFSVASLSFVAEILSARSFCFCESNSVFFGSSFRSFSTSFSCNWVFFMFLFTPSNALESLVVSPPISTVMPLILFAMRFFSFLNIDFFAKIEYNEKNSFLPRGDCNENTVL